MILVRLFAPSGLPSKVISASRTSTEWMTILSESSEPGATLTAALPTLMADGAL
jgi:hypothetical protein